MICADAHRPAPWLVVYKKERSPNGSFARISTWCEYQASCRVHDTAQRPAWRCIAGDDHADRRASIGLVENGGRAWALEVFIEHIQSTCQQCDLNLR